jgi:hypothetical protein
MSPARVTAVAHGSASRGLLQTTILNYMSQQPNAFSHQQQASNQSKTPEKSKNNKTHPTPTSFPVSDAATTSGPFNSLLCGLHPLEHSLPNSDVEFNSVASLGQVIPEANIMIDTGPADVESSSVASQDTGPSGSNFSDAPSFSSQWADT